MNLLCLMLILFFRILKIDGIRKNNFFPKYTKSFPKVTYARLCPVFSNRLDLCGEPAHTLERRNENSKAMQ